MKLPSFPASRLGIGFLPLAYLVVGMSMLGMYVVAPGQPWRWVFAVFGIALVFSMIWEMEHEIKEIARLETLSMQDLVRLLRAPTTHPAQALNILAVLNRCHPGWAVPVHE